MSDNFSSGTLVTIGPLKAELKLIGVRFNIVYYSTEQEKWLFDNKYSVIQFGTIGVVIDDLVTGYYGINACKIVLVDNKLYCIFTIRLNLFNG